MKIDIVITAYNRRDKVCRAIDSAMDLAGRTGGKVIVVDDASSDGTVLVLKDRYEDALESGRLLLNEHKVNQGVTAAKNTGFMASNAQWVIFLDSDDSLIQAKLNSAIKILSENIKAAIIFFRCSNNAGNIVGRSFSNEKWLSIAEYVEHTSYGEVLTAINRKMIVTEPYIGELRGYEGLGCARIIRDYGDVLLSNLVLREYDQSGNDRLSNGWGFAKRLGKLAKGHILFLKEFYSYMILSRKIKYLVKIITYSFIYFFVKALGKNK